MPSLAGANASINAPSVAAADMGRTTPTMPSYGGLFASVIGGAGQARQMMGERDLGKMVNTDLAASRTGNYGAPTPPDQYAPGIPGAGQGAPSSAPAGVTPAGPASPAQVAAQGAAAAEQRTGIPTDPQAQRDLQTLASNQSTFDQMQTENVRNRAAKEIFEQSNMSDFISKYPWMAREAMAATGQAQGFTEKLYSIQHGAQEAMVQNQIAHAQALQQAEFESGGNELAGKPPGYVLAHYTETKFWKDYSAAKQSETELKIAQNKYAMGQVTDNQTLYNYMDKAGPGIQQDYMSQRNRIMAGTMKNADGSDMNAAQKTAAIMQLPGQMRAYIRTNVPPNVSDDEINKRVGYLGELAKTDAEIANGGVAATAAQNRYNQLDASQKADFASKYPNYVFYQKFAEVQRQMPNEFNLKMQGVGFSQSFAGYLGSAIKNGPGGEGGPRHDPIPAGTPPQAAAEQGANAAQLVLGHTAKWQDLDDQTKGNIAAHSLNVLGSSAHNESDAPMDKWIEAMADPSFKDVAQRPEFVNHFTKSMADNIGRYGYNATQGLLSAYPELNQMALKLTKDADGYYQIASNDPKISPAHQQALSKYNQAVGRAQRAVSNIQGYSPEQAQQWFVNTALAVSSPK